MNNYVCKRVQNSLENKKTVPLITMGLPWGQWLRVHAANSGAWVRSLVGELDPACHH